MLAPPRAAKNTVEQLWSGFAAKKLRNQRNCSRNKWTRRHKKEIAGSHADLVARKDLRPPSLGKGATR